MHNSVSITHSNVLKTVIGGKKNVSSHQKLLLNLKQRVDCKWARGTTENGTGISEQTVKLVEEVWKHICVSPKRSVKVGKITPVSEQKVTQTNVCTFYII